MRFVDAILSGNIGQVRKLLKQGMDANARIEGERGYPLHFASHSYVNIMQLLIDNGADVNVKDEGGQTPLHIASYAGYAKGVRLLLENGAEVNVTDNKGRTPLYAASQEIPLYGFISGPLGVPPSADELKEREDRKEVVQLLKSYGAEENWKKETKSTPEEVTQRTGMNEEELTRRFLLHLIQKEGKNPFTNMPEKHLKECLKKYPDIVGLAREKFGEIK